MNIRRILREEIGRINESFDFGSILANGISVNNEYILNRYHLNKLTLIKKGNYIVISMIISSDKGKGFGTRFMEDITSWADNNNIRLALTPDDSFGASSIYRLKKFYKRFGFIENKGRHMDYSINESMIRIPN